MRQRKYEAGEPITDIRDLVTELEARRYVWMLERPAHPAFVGSMHFWTLLHMCRRGCFRRAVKREEKAA